MDTLALFEESSGQPAKNPIFDLFPGESRSYHLIPKNGADTVVEVQPCPRLRPAESHLRLPVTWLQLPLTWPPLPLISFPLLSASPPSSPTSLRLPGPSLSYRRPFRR